MQEKLEVPGFFSGFPVPVRIALGNHDPGMEQLAPGIAMEHTGGFAVGECYCSHGHAWPGKEAFSCITILTGHLHPCIEFRDHIGKVWEEPVWVRARLSRKRLATRYAALPHRLPELIVVPAFNPLAGGIPLNRMQPEQNREHIGPLVKCADLERADITLLDGTYLGKLKSLKEKQ